MGRRQPSWRSPKDDLRRPKPPPSPPPPPLLVSSTVLVVLVHAVSGTVGASSAALGVFVGGVGRKQCESTSDRPVRPEEEAAHHVPQLVRQLHQQRGLREQVRLLL